MKVVIGVDSGGTKTRALAVTLDGERAGYAETGGGNPGHDREARANVREAIRLAAAECGLSRVVRVVAGIAGFDHKDQETSVAEATEVEGLAAARTHLNDAEIAHYAAFGDSPGIVSIQGTGSTIRARLEGGRQVVNGDFFHYARAGAVWVGIKAVQKLLAEPERECEAAVREGALFLWKVATVAALRETVSRQSELEAVERSRRYGELARLVTASAEAGGPLGSSVCDRAADEIARGVRLLGPMFASEEVSVAMVGACGTSPAVRGGVARRLAASEEKRYMLVNCLRTPVEGAVLMALAAEGVSPEEAGWGLRRPN